MLKFCTDCESEHMGINPCGLTYIQRLRSQTVDTAWMPTKTKRNYYDSGAIEGLFGDDAEDRMMEETQGVGAYTAEDRKNYPGIESFYTMADDEELVS